MRKKKICLMGLSALLVISGVFVYKNVSSAKSNGLTLEQAEAILREYGNGNPDDLTQEQIKDVLKEYADANPGIFPTEEEISGRFREYVEANYGPGTDFGIVSYGSSGVGYVNHETGEVIEYVRDTGDER